MTVKHQHHDEVIERHCVVSGERLDAHQLIRFVADDTGCIFPDIGNKVKGDGAHIKADRAVLEEALKTGVLLKVLKAEHSVEHMADIVDALLVKRCQEHIAMARRSGMAIGGGGKIRSLGDVAGLIIADDASTREARAIRGDVTHDWIVSVLGSHEIGVPFGRQALAFAAILPSQAYGMAMQSEKLSQELRRLATYRHKRPKKSDMGENSADHRAEGGNSAG